MANKPRKSDVAAENPQLPPPNDVYRREGTIREEVRRGRDYYAIRDALSGEIKRALLDAPRGDVLWTVQVVGSSDR